MPRRQALIIEAGGERFRLDDGLDDPGTLHITRRHGTTATDAIRTFFAGATEPWDESRRRFETRTETRGLFWTRHAHDRSVVVISCFGRGEESSPTWTS